MTAVKLTVKVVEAIPAPGKNACGLVWDGSVFWFFDHGRQMLHKIDREGEILKEFIIKNACCDTAFDGEYLLQGAPDHHQILVINPADGKIIQKIPTQDKCSGLCITPFMEPQTADKV